MDFLASRVGVCLYGNYRLLFEQVKICSPTLHMLEHCFSQSDGLMLSMNIHFWMFYLVNNAI